MEKIDFDSLRKCEDLYNFQVNRYDFDNGIIYANDSTRRWYPMPISGREMIADVSHPDRPIKKFDYSEYVHGLNDVYNGMKVGYNEPLTDILNIAISFYYSPGYVSHNGLSGSTDSYEYGCKVGRLYHAWMYIANNIEKFTNWRELLEPKHSGLLETKLNTVRMTVIHQYLVDKKYIECDINTWLYWFTLRTWNDQNKKPQPIKWTGAAYILTNVVYQICGNMNKQTETVMQKSFVLPKGSNFQNMTITKKKPLNDKEPYKSIHNMMKFAERYIKDLP